MWSEGGLRWVTHPVARPPPLPCSLLRRCRRSVLHLRGPVRQIPLQAEQSECSQMLGRALVLRGLLASPPAPGALQGPPDAAPAPPSPRNIVRERGVRSHLCTGARLLRARGRPREADLRPTGGGRGGGQVPYLAVAREPEGRDGRVRAAAAGGALLLVSTGAQLL